MNYNEFLALVDAHRSEILAEMRECYAYHIRSGGNAKYKIYIWSDGEIETLEYVGYSSYLRAKDCEPREILYVVTVGDTPTDWRDFVGESFPDEPEPYDYDSDEDYKSAHAAYEYEMERIRTETEDWLIDDYDPEEYLSTALESEIDWCLY